MISIHWFRRDLRVEDNRALNAALQSGYPVRCIFIFDRQILDKLEDRSDARVTFIHGELQSLDTTLRKYGSSLQVFFGNPLEVWQDILSTTDVKEVFCNRDYEPYAIQRDKQVYDLMLSRGVKFSGRKDHVIFEKDEVVKDDGKPYTVFTPYSRKWKLLLKSRLSEIDSTTAKFNFETNSSGTIPTLESMGFTRNSTIAIPSKEIASDVIIRYHEQRDIPSLNGTSRLSLHLRFGTIGIRELVRIGLDKNEKWLNELIWRDF
ncbi:MAG: deoxyribodipyrimidine photo-lyase, partial [Flavobacteriales bacterium]